MADATTTPAKTATSHGRPPARKSRYMARSASHSCITQGWPAALNEYTSTCGIELVATISLPFARCHQRSGSSGGTAARLKMAANRRTRSTTVLVTRRSRAPTLPSPGRTVATLAHHPNDEAGQSDHAAPAPRLVTEPVQPFQAPIPHPAGGPAHPARNEVESPAPAHPAHRGRPPTRAGAAPAGGLPRPPLRHPPAPGRHHEARRRTPGPARPA